MISLNKLKLCTKLWDKNFIMRFIQNERIGFKRTLFLRPASLLNPVNLCSTQNLRFKSKNFQKNEVSESEPDSYDNDKFDEVEDKYTKVLNINVTSLRVDAILKSSLGMSRNKIETLFYESKIRLNGEKIQKKSASVQEGDEIDLIKGPDAKNTNFMNVARVEILSIKGNEDSISVKIKRCKSLTVEAYR